MTKRRTGRNTLRAHAVAVLGWYGVAAILAAYTLNSFNALDSTVPYQLLNLTGAVGIVVVSWHRRAYQPMVLNAIWAVIALISLTGLLIRR
jgi:hypothetical protein